MKNVDPERWKKIEQILDELLDMEESERQAHLEKACGDDAELKGQVEEMLGASKKASTFLESEGRTHLENALRSLAARVEEPAEEREEPRMVGPYRLIRKLGRGGMGQVYLAVRDDEAFKRYVAVKVIRRGMDTDDILRRFRTERRILASLTHANIARLLDGGATDDGTSYFVMEYVEGKPITEYCDEHALSLDARLDLFAKVCSAVHYAHQNLIIHRDLKPANILVTNTGDVKLLDFGIAKFLNRDLTGYTLPMTETEIRVMTPEYASPEQVRGGSVTTASDVYQLGVLLYELLTGHRPFAFQTLPRGEIEKIILEKEPERPSTAISRVGTQEKKQDTESPDSVSRKRSTPFDRLRKQLSGDLDWIVLMALRKETSRRYQSADQLLEDIRRYRSSLPVSAQADTWTYRSGKFIKRHKMGVVMSLAFALLLIVSTITAVNSAITNREQRERIELEAAKTGQVKDFLVGLFEVANPEFSRGREVTAREILDAGAESVLEDLDDQPEIQTEMMHTIGIVYADLGYFEQADPLLREALELRRESAGGQDTPGVAQSLFDLGYLLDEGGDFEQAVAYYRQALEMQLRLHGADALVVARTHNDLAEALYNYEGPDAVLPHLEEALRIRSLHLGERHQDVAEVLSNLGVVYHDSGDFEQAEVHYRKALDMIRELEGPDHPIVASNLYNLGTLMYDLQVYEEARAHFRDALEIRVQLYDEQNPYVARTINWLGRVAMARGALTEAQERFEHSLRLHRQIYGDIDFYVGLDTKTLGDLAVQQGEIERAEQLYVQAIMILEQVLGDANPRTQLARVDLGSLYMKEGQFGDAIAQFERVMRQHDANPDADRGQVAWLKMLLGESYIRADQPDDARALLNESLGYYEAFEPDNAEAITQIRELLVEAGE